MRKPILSLTFMVTIMLVAGGILPSFADASSSPEVASTVASPSFVENSIDPPTVGLKGNALLSTSGAATDVHPSVAPTTPGYVPVNPARLMDTRNGQLTVDGVGAGTGGLSSGVTRDLPVVARGGVPAAGVAGVALNVTVTGPTAPSFLTVWPSGSSRPVASNLNFGPGETVPNMVVVKIGTGGMVSIFNNLGSVDVIVDVLGWYLTDAEFQPVVPARLMETRYGLSTVDGWANGGGALPGGYFANLTVVGRGGVPSTGVSSVVLNVTVTGTSAPGYLTVWPSGESPPLASNLNFETNTTIPNMVVAKVGTNGQISIANSAGSVHVIVDVLGWYQTDSVFASLSPARLMDTRSGQRTADGIAAGGGAIAGGTVRTLQVTGRGGVPQSGVGAVALNVTVTAPTAPGYLTVWPTGAQQPLASNLNFRPSQTIPNSVIAKVGTNGQISIFNSMGNVDVVVDVQGWFTSAVVGAPTAVTNFTVDAPNPEETRPSRMPDNSLVVKWSPSARNGGSVITGYVATASPSGASCTVSPSTQPMQCSLTGLPMGVAQSVTVKAVNKLQFESSSTAQSATPYALTQISVVDRYLACGRESNGQVACWGTYSNYNPTGRGVSGAHAYQGANWVYTVDGSGSVVPLTGVDQVSVSESHGCAVQSAGSVYCWGWNGSGAIGTGVNRNGQTADAPYATLVPGISNAVRVVALGDSYNSYYQATCVLLATGTVKCWGWSGLLGLGSGIGDQTEPADVAGISGAIDLQGSDRTLCALVTGGVMKCWGRYVNTETQGTYAYTPTTVASISNVSQMAVGSNRKCGLISGTLKCWGQLRENLATNSYSSTLPKSYSQITGTIVRVFTGEGDNICAVTSQNQTWCWGGNSSGQLLDPSVPFGPNETPTIMNIGVAATGGAAASGVLCVIKLGGSHLCWGNSPSI